MNIIEQHLLQLNTMNIKDQQHLLVRYLLFHET